MINYEQIVEKDISKEGPSFNIVINLKDLELALAAEQINDNADLSEYTISDLPIYECSANGTDMQLSSDSDQNIMISEEQIILSADNQIVSDVSLCEIQNNSTVEQNINQVQGCSDDRLVAGDIKEEGKDDNNDRGNESSNNDEEPITDDEELPKHRRDPLKKSLFSKVKKIPKLLITDQLVSTEEMDKDKEVFELYTIAVNDDDVPVDGKNVPEVTIINKPIKSEDSNAEKMLQMKAIDDNMSSDKPTSSNEINESSAIEVPHENCGAKELIGETETTCSNDDTYSQTSRSDNEVPIDDRTATNSDSPSDNESSSTSRLQKSKTTRLTPSEYDDFLNKNFNLKCDLCQEGQKTFNELRKHFSKIHNNKNPYALCCSKKFLRRAPLVEHVQWHCEPNNYTCKYCGKVMSCRRTLKLHERHVHEKSYTKYSCDICGKSFANGNVLKNHKLIHLSEDEKQFKCNHCEKRYVS